MKKIFTLAVFALMLIAPQNVAAQSTGTENGHEWVDLGIPSGTLWATCNVGADSPEEYGDYFAWGETKPKSNYEWINYKWGKDPEKLTKYCSSRNNGLDGFTDDKIELELDDDAAHVNWGSDWLMPTEADLQDLMNNTTLEWKDNYKNTGANGVLFTASNGNSIFLPAAGYRYGTSLKYAGDYGEYLSRSRGSGNPAYVPALYLSRRNIFDIIEHYYFDEHNYDITGWCVREMGNSIRPVRKPAVKPFMEWVNLGLPSGTLWATCNVGANNPEEYGDYFAWGETEPKVGYYLWSTYKHCKGSYNTLTKYCNDSSDGYNGYTDTKTTLDIEDDAARANREGDWRMPTEADFQELINNTTSEWKENYKNTGANGLLFTASNRNSIFLPAAGYRFGTWLLSDGSYGYYWSSTLGTDYPYAYSLDFYSGDVGVNPNSATGYRCNGHTIRPVRGGNAIETSVSAPRSSAGQRNAPMYNLFGQKVGKDYKGIVIQNGRKLVKY